MDRINSQFRVDDVDENKALVILKKYESKHSAKYLVVREKASQSQKDHLQGWVSHFASDNTYRTTMARHYSTLGTHSKCFTMVKDFTVYVSYIINNDSKPDIQYDNCLTNYTLEEFEQFKNGPRFLKPVSATCKATDWYSQMLNHLEESCVEDGKIIYNRCLTEFLKDPPKRMSVRLGYDYLASMLIRLEDKYPHNCRAKSRMVRGITELGDGLFDAYYD